MYDRQLPPEMELELYRTLRERRLRQVELAWAARGRAPRPTWPGQLLLATGGAFIALGQWLRDRVPASQLSVGAANQ